MCQSATSWCSCRYRNWSYFQNGHHRVLRAELFIGREVDHDTVQSRFDVFGSPLYLDRPTPSVAAGVCANPHGMVVGTAGPHVVPIPLGCAVRSGRTDFRNSPTHLTLSPAP